MPDVTNDLVSSITTLKAELSAARLAATTSLTNLLENNTKALSLLVHALEIKHGLAAAYAELRATEAKQLATDWALAAEALLWDTRQLAYPPEARTALANYRRHLRDAGRRLEDGARVREAELADYGVASVRDTDAEKSEVAAAGERGVWTAGDEHKERTMREMARVWREMEARLREIQGDLNRLR